MHQEKGYSRTFSFDSQTKISWIVLSKKGIPRHTKACKMFKNLLLQALTFRWSISITRTVIQNVSFPKELIYLTIKNIFKYPYDRNQNTQFLLTKSREYIIFSKNVSCSCLLILACWHNGSRLKLLTILNMVIPWGYKHISC